MLGSNVLPAVRADQQNLAAVNRSLHAHGEVVDGLAPVPEATAVTCNRCICYVTRRLGNRLCECKEFDL